MLAVHVPVPCWKLGIHIALSRVTSFPRNFLFVLSRFCHSYRLAVGSLHNRIHRFLKQTSRGKALVHHWCPPVMLLLLPRRHVVGGTQTTAWVDQVQLDRSILPGDLRIGQLEGVGPVLHNLGKGNKSPCSV